MARRRRGDGGGMGTSRLGFLLPPLVFSFPSRFLPHLRRGGLGRVRTAARTRPASFLCASLPCHAWTALLDYPILPCLAVAPVQKLAVRSRRFKRARPARALPKPSAGSRPFPWYRTRVLLVLVHSAQHVDVTLFTVKRWQNTVSHNIIYIP